MPGGKRILKIKINAQHNAFSKTMLESYSIRRFLDLHTFGPKPPVLTAPKKIK